jgi:hypothetical protein
VTRGAERQGRQMTAPAQATDVRGRFAEQFARAKEIYFQKKEAFVREAAGNPAQAVAWCGGVIESQYAADAYWVVLRCLEKVGRRHGYASDREAVEAGLRECTDELLALVGSLGGNAFGRAACEAKAAGYAATIREIRDWVL